MEAVPFPEPPIIDVPSQVPGAPSQKFAQDQDPEYLRERGKAFVKRYEILTELQWLYGLPEITPPVDDAWKEEIKLFLPDIEWRAGPRGRRADYIEYVVLSNAEDQRRLRDAIEAISTVAIPEELSKAAEESFRGDVQGEAT
jgi:hypothetical protein